MLISICIPTYNSGDKLIRLLDSVKKQTFTDYEIVISDDSRNNSVKEIIDHHYSDLNIRYYHNTNALGTPANWNNAVALSKGEWIKLMHHDDWFLDETALQTFVDHISVNPRAKLLFCAFKNVDILNNTTSVASCSAFEIQLLKWNYLNLYKNFIGNPSCTLVSSALKPYEYDKRIKWLIDFDFYTWFFRKEKEFTYIKNPIIAFALHPGQVTAQTKCNPEVEIPESFLLYDKYGIGLLRNIFAYDFFWRMYRNLGIRNIEQIERYLGRKNDYPSIDHMIRLQSKVPQHLLKKGYISKTLMLIGYIKNRFLTGQ